MKARLLNFERLQDELDKHEIPSTWYLIGALGISEDKTVIVQNADKWSVYYSERGNKCDERVFDNENDACYNLLNRMIQKQTKL